MEGVGLLVLGLVVGPAESGKGAPTSQCLVKAGESFDATCADDSRRPR